MATPHAAITANEDLLRHILQRLTSIDERLSRLERKRKGPTRTERDQLAVMVRAIGEAACGAGPFTVRELLEDELLKDDLHAVLEDQFGPIEFAAIRIGKKIGSVDGVELNGFRIDRSGDSHGVALWVVSRVECKANQAPQAPQAA